MYQPRDTSSTLLNRTVPMFYFKTVSISLRKTLASMGATLLFLCLIDVAARIWNPIDLYGGWGTPDLEAKMKMAKERANQVGKIDAMVMGSSVGRRIDVGQWERAFGGKLSAFNACFLGQRPQFNRFMFENALWESAHPSLLILAVTPIDMNGFGLPGSAMRRSHPFWRTYQVRRLTATTFAQKLGLAAERFSYLFAAREQARQDLQKGETEYIHYYLDDNTAVEYPSVNRTPDDPKSRFYTQVFGDLFGKFSLPEDGELLDIRELARFCKDRGVRFVVASLPIAPVSFEAYGNAHMMETSYTTALARLQSEGVEILNMQGKFPVSNGDFGDPVHPNGRGAQKITTYLYENVVRSTFAEECRQSDAPLTLPAPVEVAPCASASESSAGICIDLNATIKSPQPRYGSDRQLSITHPGATVSLGDSFAPGTYRVDIYGADRALNEPLAEKMTNNGYLLYGYSVSQLPYPQHEFGLTVTPHDGPSTSTRFRSSLVLVRRNQFTRHSISLPTTSSLSLTVEQIGKGPAVIDTVFVRRQPGS